MNKPESHKIYQIAARRSEGAKFQGGMPNNFSLTMPQLILSVTEQTSHATIWVQAANCEIGEITTWNPGGLQADLNGGGLGGSTPPGTKKVNTFLGAADRSCASGTAAPRA